MSEQDKKEVRVRDIFFIILGVFAMMIAGLFMVTVPKRNQRPYGGDM